MSNPNRKVRTAIQIEGVRMTPARETEVHSHLMIELIRSIPNFDPDGVSITFTYETSNLP